MGLTIIAAPAFLDPRSIRAAARRLRALIVPAALLYLTLAGIACTPPAGHQPLALIFFADGLDREVLDRELDAGRLPNIARYFVQGGVRVETVACLPSVTYLNTASLMTGMWPARHGVYGNVWWDRRARQGRDYRSVWTFRRINEDIAAPTLYERLPDWRGVSILCHTRRGSRIDIDHGLANGLDWLAGNFKSVDARSGAALETFLLTFSMREPTVILAYFPGADEIAHHDGVDSPRYARAIENIDGQIGRAMRALKLRGRLDDAYLALITDHGHAESGRQQLNVARWFDDRGYDVESDCDDSPDADEIFIVCGGGRGKVVMVPGPSGYSEPAALETLERIVFGDSQQPGLAHEPAVGLVAFAPGDEIIVAWSAGRAVIHRRETGTGPQYAWISDDPPPVELGAEFVIPGQVTWLDGREWLSATFDASWPDLVPQLAEYFRSSRAGDLLVFAAQDARFDKDRGVGHGGPWATETRISHFWRGPGLITDKRVAPARVLDFLPTLLDLLGEPVQPGKYDGISLAPLLKKKHEDR